MTSRSSPDSPARDTASSGVARSPAGSDAPSRSAGEYLHVAIDDATRLAYAELLPDERGETAAGFLERALARYALHGVAVERVMSGNVQAVVRAYEPRLVQRGA